MDINDILNTAGLRTITSGNLDVFRYGLQKKDNFESQYEDPTYLGFTIELDTNSALFTQVLPFLEKHSATRQEMQSRIPVYKAFVDRVQTIFNSQESVASPNERDHFVKQHYINNVSGLSNFAKKFIKWREDKIDIELYEDIALSTSYLAHLYNNLIYSYENGRMIIPENLLKFNLRIKISEIRNLTSIGKLKSEDATDQAIVNALKYNVTCIVYKLFDCEFDFFNSQPFGNEISQAGIGQNIPAESTVPMSIYFKSVGRHIFAPLVKNSLSINDNKVDLGIVIVNSNGSTNPNGQVTSGGLLTGPNGEPFQQLEADAVSNGNIEGFPSASTKKPSDLSTYNIETEKRPETKTEFDLSQKAEQLQNLMDYDDELAPDGTPLRNTQFPSLQPGEKDSLLDKIVGKDITNLAKDPTAALKDLGNKVAKKVENTANWQLHLATQKLKQKRNELVRKFVNDVERKVGLKKIVPDNVYTNQDYYKNLLDMLKSDIGLTIGDEVIKIITKN
jgi:hypothetical protein